MLTERTRMAVRSIDEFKKQFGIGKRRNEPLSEEEIQDRRQIHLKTLLATVSPK